MAITYVVDKVQHVIFETWTGAVTAEELANHWTIYLADPEVIQCRTTLVDLRNSTIKFNGQQLADLVQTIVIPKLGSLKWKSALLVEKPVQFGVSRQYGVFAQFYSQDQIFHDYDSALKWLLQA